MAMVFAPPTAAPTMDDARRVAAVLAELGAGRVLVFGSVARGDATAASDIDLVAVYDDLGDYASRADLRAKLTARARQVTDAAVDLWVTDRAEWRRRTAVVTSSFEAAIASHTFVLENRSPSAVIDWDKVIGMPADNRAEALERLKDTDNALGRVFNGLYEGAKERVEASRGDERRWANARYERMAFICTDSQLTIENAFKTVACLLGAKAERIHSLQQLADSLPAEYADVIRPATDPQNHVKPSGITLWHTAGPYIAKRPALTLDEIEDTAIELARLANQTAAALAGHFTSDSDAKTAVADITHTVGQIHIGLSAGDIGQANRRTVGVDPPIPGQGIDIAP